jgi:hypothetical protein
VLDIKDRWAVGTGKLGLVNSGAANPLLEALNMELGGARVFDEVDAAKVWDSIFEMATRGDNVITYLILKGAIV